MIIACPACGTRYAVPDSAIGLEGRTVRCAKCRHSWFQDGPELAMQAPTAPAVAIATAAPESAPSVPSAPASAPAPTRPPTRPAIVTPARERPVAAAPIPQPVPPQTSAPAAVAPGREPLAELPVRPASARRIPSSYYDDTVAEVYADEAPSSFDHAPPFRPRRNWTKIATWGAAVFALVTLGLAGAIAWGGLPDWVPIPRATFEQAQPDLKLDFPRNRQDRKPLPDGTEFFSVSGTISNIGRETRAVPSLLVVLRNQRETVVYEKEVVPSRRQLAPGETITVNEALTDIPKAAASAEIGWKPD